MACRPLCIILYHESDVGVVGLYLIDVCTGHWFECLLCCLARGWMVSQWSRLDTRHCVHSWLYACHSSQLSDADRLCLFDLLQQLEWSVVECWAVWGSDGLSAGLTTGGLATGNKTPTVITVISPHSASLSSSPPQGLFWDQTKAGSLFSPYHPNVSQHLLGWDTIWWLLVFFGDLLCSVCSALDFPGLHLCLQFCVPHFFGWVTLLNFGPFWVDARGIIRSHTRFFLLWTIK